MFIFISIHLFKNGLTPEARKAVRGKKHSIVVPAEADESHPIRAPVGLSC
jgi:hypothetical protein